MRGTDERRGDARVDAKAKALRPELAKDVLAQAMPARTVHSPTVPEKYVPARTIAAKARVAKAVPAKTVPAKAVPAKAAPAKAVPAKAAPAKAIRAQTVPEKDVPARTIAAKAGPAKAGPAKAGPAKAGASKFGIKTMAAILQAARAQGVRIATAESCTGGMVAAALTDVAGSSDVFDRGFVTYSNAAKVAMLGVSAATLTRFGAVSEEIAGEMADGALAQSEAGLAVSITGIAGPGGSEFKPEGRVCFGLARHGATTKVETVEFGVLGRAAVRLAARNHALGLLMQALG